jgi:hypothetical protein
MSRKNSQPGPAPCDGGEAAWLWVLAAPITVNRDKLLVLEDEAGDYLPVFKAKEDGRAFLKRLNPEGDKNWQAQAMHLVDLKALAAEKLYRLLILSGEGQVLERYGPSPEN